MGKDNVPSHQDDSNQNVVKELTSTPSSEIVRLLRVLERRFARLFNAKNERSFDRDKQQLAFSRSNRIEIEDVLHTSFTFSDVKGPLRELFRTECLRAGSMDSDAIAVMTKVFDAITKTRQLSIQLTVPSKTLDPRENKKVADEASVVLRHSITEVLRCSRGKQTTDNLPPETTRRPPRDADGPVSNDFRNFRINGEILALTPMQAAVVRVYWNAWCDSIDQFSESSALEQAGCKSQRLHDLFKSNAKKNSGSRPILAKLFKAGEKKGMFSLNLSE